MGGGKTRGKEDGLVTGKEAARTYIEAISPLRPPLVHVNK